MSDDISPSSRPFHTRIRDMISCGDQAAHMETAYTVHAYVDLAKRILLENRVRDFTAADVVSLVAVMESRDRALRKAGGGE